MRERKCCKGSCPGGIRQVANQRGLPRECHGRPLALVVRNQAAFEMCSGEGLPASRVVQVTRMENGEGSAMETCRRPAAIRAGTEFFLRLRVSSR